MTDTRYEFDVAFSFLNQDESLAYEINDLVQDRFKTFLYSERQKELAGTDGEKTFNEVFSEKARIVVILFREEWGTTSWTRIEETAIRNRAHNNGYDFTTFVQLDPNSKMPIWLPKNRIYYNYDRWGIKGLAPVIEARIQEAGGENKPDTLEDQAARMKRQMLNHKERQMFLQSDEAYAKAQEKFNELIKLLQARTKTIEDPEMALHFYYDTKMYNKVIVHCEGFSLNIKWKYAFSNSLTDSGLYIDFISANTESLSRNRSRQSQERVLKRDKLNFDFNPSTKETGWSVESKESDFYSSEKLIENWLKIFLENVIKIRLDRQQAR